RDGETEPRNRAAGAPTGAAFRLAALRGTNLGRGLHDRMAPRPADENAYVHLARRDRGDDLGPGGHVRDPQDGAPTDAGRRAQLRGVVLAGREALDPPTATLCVRRAYDRDYRLQGQLTGSSTTSTIARTRASRPAPAPRTWPTSRSGAGADTTRPEQTRSRRRP